MPTTSAGRSGPSMCWAVKVVRAAGSGLSANHAGREPTRWEAVEEIVSLFQRNKTVLGEEVSKICLAEAARRSARLAAAKPPQSPRLIGHPSRPRSRNAGRRMVTEKSDRSRSKSS